MAPHFLPPRNGGKNREGLCPFEPLWSPTRALRPLSLGAAGLRHKAAKRRLATEQLAIFDCETVPVRWGYGSTEEYRRSVKITPQLKIAANLPR